MQVADIMVPLLKFWFPEDVRRAAVQTLPELLRSAVMCRDKGLNNVDNNLVKQVRVPCACVCDLWVCLGMCVRRYVCARRHCPLPGHLW